MIAFVVALSLAAAPAPAAAKPDASWVIDAELGFRAKAARDEAARRQAAAAAAEKIRNDAQARKSAAEAEKAQLTASAATLSGKKKREAEARIAELDGQSALAAQKLAGAAQDAANARAAAAQDLAAATAIDAEAALRRKQAADALPLNAEMGSLADARLTRAKTWAKQRLARVPAQIAAIEAELDREQTQQGRAALSEKAERVRAEKEQEEAFVERVDQELSYRTEAKAQEGEEAAALARQASARASASDTPMPEALSTSAHSIAIEKKLDQILAEQDARAAEEAATKVAHRSWLRVGLGIFGIAAVLGGIGWMLWRGMR